MLKQITGIMSKEKQTYLSKVTNNYVNIYNGMKNLTLVHITKTSNQISKFSKYSTFHTKTNTFLGKLRSYIHGPISSIHQRRKRVGKRPSL